MTARVVRTGALVTFALLAAGCARHALDAPSGGRSRIAGPAGVLAVDDGGTGGLPVVFLHSYAGSKAHWAAQLAHLRKTRRAVAIDLRGHGDSAAPPDNVYSSPARAARGAPIGGGG